MKIYRKYTIFQNYKVVALHLNQCALSSIWISKFNWAWQVQFLSYNLETLEKWVFLKDLQMILVPYFHIPAGFQLRKKRQEVFRPYLETSLHKPMFVLVEWSIDSSSHFFRSLSFLPIQLHPPWRHIASSECWAIYWPNEVRKCEF